jgi:DNA-binding winged helix-turn-helix (wHTH) protein/predicted ATPase
MGDRDILLFEPFRLDLADERLWCGEDAIRLTNKAFAVLRTLVEHPGQLVTKDALLDTVWADTVVSEAALSVCIRELRQALGDDARAPQFIETVRGRGYRFVAPVTIVERSPAAPQAGAPPRPLPRTAPSFIRAPVALVGREAELAQLHQWFAAALRGERRVGFITGEAGIGKTTLVDAFVAQAGREEALWIGHGQCVDQYGAGEAYLPVLEALGRLCRGPEGEPILALLRQHAPSWLGQMPALLRAEERAELEPSASGATQARMLRELAEVVETLTAERPLVLVFEDLHWSDASTLAWLGYVARRREAARLLVLGTYRPVEAIVADHPLRTLAHELRRHGQCEELLLDYLSEAAVAAYLTERNPGPEPPAGLARMLHRRTDGNPLFLVMLVDTLVRQGALEEGPAGWALPHGLERVTVGVPESLRQMIEQQFEQMGAEDQTILEAASVAGAEFSAAAVAAGLGRQEEAVEARCATLARRGQFVEPRGPAVWPDGTVTTQYGFTHALYPEVLYHRVPAGQRVRLHRQIGVRLEVGYGAQAQEIAGELAEHLVRGRDAPRAVPYLRLAGENAWQRSAYQEAIAHLTKGLEVLGTLPDTVARARQELDLQTTLGVTCMAAKGWAAPEVGTAYGRARALCQQRDETAQLGPVLGGLWVFHKARAELHTAREMAEEMLQLGQQTRDLATLGGAHHGLGEILYDMGEFSSSKDHCEEAIAFFSRQLQASPLWIVSLQDWGVINLGYMAWNLWYLGYPDQALHRAYEALGQAREQSHPFTLVTALFVATLVHGYRREGALSQELNEEMLALSVEQGFPLYTETGRFLRGAMRVAQGRVKVEEGIAQMRQSMDTYWASGAETARPGFLAILATVQRAAGRFEDGLASLAEAQAAVDRTGERRHESTLSRLKGAISLRHRSRDQDARDNGGKTVEAEACFHHAIDVAREQKAKSLELQAATRLARLWQQQGMGDEARKLLGDIYGWFSEGFDTGDLKDAKALLEEWSA